VGKKGVIKTTTNPNWGEEGEGEKGIDTYQVGSQRRGGENCSNHPRKKKKGVKGVPVERLRDQEGHQMY